MADLTRLRTLAEKAAAWVHDETGGLDGERAYQEWVETYGSQPEAWLGLLDRLNGARAEFKALLACQGQMIPVYNDEFLRAAWVREVAEAGLVAVDRAEGETP